MKFEEIFSALTELLDESLTMTTLSNFNQQIETVDRMYRREDKIKFKEELKNIKKRLMSKLVKDDYKSLLTKYFPSLKERTNLTDDEFKNVFYNSPAVWENMEPETFESFQKDFEKALEYFSSRNYSQHNKLALLSKNYLRY